MMKMKKNILVVLTIVMMLLSGCGNTTTSSEDYTFWEKSNDVRLVITSIGVMDVAQDDEFSGLGELELSSSYLKQVKKLQEAMLSYFETYYGIDISEEIGKQKLRGFESAESDTITMGYVDSNNPDYLNLNSLLFGAYSMYFSNVYVHETLHQIGFINANGVMITEGIVDALTDLILTEANIRSYPTDSYAASRTLGYQILASDNEIASFYLNNSDSNIEARIAEVLRDVEYPFEEADPGERLEDLLEALTYETTGTVDEYYIAFEAQEIVQAYCQAFDPNAETIDYIRSLYLVEDYESITITAITDGYQFS